MPWIGAFLALVTLGATIRRKGLFRGTLDTALDFTPVVGGVKNLAEAVRGRDFIRDRRTVQGGREPPLPY
jgi:Pre-toxin TG